MYVCNLSGLLHRSVTPGDLRSLQCR